MNRWMTSSLLLACCVSSGCADQAAGERVRVAIVDDALAGADVCLFSGAQALRFTPEDGVTPSVPVDLSEEVFVAVVEQNASCEGAEPVVVQRFDEGPDLNDHSDERAVVLALDEDLELQASMVLEVAEASTSLRSCTLGDSYVVRTSICSSSGTITTVSLRECQSVHVPMEGSVNLWVTTGTWTTSSGGGCSGGPGGGHQE